MTDNMIDWLLSIGIMSEIKQTDRSTRAVNIEFNFTHEKYKLYLANSVEEMAKLLDYLSTRNTNHRVIIATNNDWYSLIPRIDEFGIEVLGKVQETKIKSFLSQNILLQFNYSRPDGPFTKLVLQSIAKEKQLGFIFKFIRKQLRIRNKSR